MCNSKTSQDMLYKILDLVFNKESYYGEVAHDFRFTPYNVSAIMKRLLSDINKM
jgi:hypothetical protein